MRIFLIVMLILFFNLKLASATDVGLPWKGDYPHNSSKHWSRDNQYDSGFSKYFLNGAPEEGGKVQKDGQLTADISLPKDAIDPIPFMIVMHGCTGLTKFQKEWAKHVASVLNAQGIGVLVLDSFSTRAVKQTCGMPDFHWGRRRADDAYSALDYLIEHKLAKADEVYLMGQSNGGLATLVAMSKQESDHPHEFAAGFPLVPSCIARPVKYGDYVRPMIIFGGDKDDANPVRYCVEMLKRKRADPIQLIIYKDANHGFMEDQWGRVVYGWTDQHGTVHNWTLSYNPAAEKDMMATIVAAIKTKTFARGIEVRPK